MDKSGYMAQNGLLRQAQAGIHVSWICSAQSPIPITLTQFINHFWTCFYKNPANLKQAWAYYLRPILYDLD